MPLRQISGMTIHRQRSASQFFAHGRFANSAKPKTSVPTPNHPNNAPIPSKTAKN